MHRLHLVDLRKVSAEASTNRSRVSRNATDSILDHFKRGPLCDFPLWEVDELPKSAKSGENTVQNSVKSCSGASKFLLMGSPFCASAFSSEHLVDYRNALDIGSFYARTSMQVRACISCIWPSIESRSISDRFLRGPQCSFAFA